MEENIIKISVAADFSRTPGTRYKVDGLFSGEEFREKLLEPYFKNTKDTRKIEVDLDGVRGYTTSFLEESFGGLVRKFGGTVVKERIIIQAIRLKFFKAKANQYIDEEILRQNSSK